MLIPSDRLRPGDLEAWNVLERDTARRLLVPSYRDRLERMGFGAAEAIRAFLPPGYVGVSWGKDSVVVAHLARLVDPATPLVWCRIGAADNPDCAAVREAFLARFPGVGPDAYTEIVSEVELDDGELQTGARRGAYALAGDRFGDRYVSGVRSEESRTRRIREAVHGVATLRTCAPITRWTAHDVFAWLHLHDLPVHPAYAMSRGGLLDRARLRVASLGGKRGTGMGRREWEWTYYEAELVALGVRW